MIKTAHYTLHVNLEKQRLYSTLNGLWDNEEISIQHQKDVYHCLKKLGVEFTVLVDTTEFRVPNISILERIKQIQKYCVSKGMIKSAEVMSRSMLASLALDHITKCNKISETDRQRFNNLLEAEKWLDEILVRKAS